MSDLKYVGKSIPRVDAWDKVTGAGVFTHDVTMPGMLFAKVLRSPHAHARIVSIDTSEAEALPGVKAVATHKNTTRRLFNTSATMVTTNPGMEPVLDQHIFTDVVRYIGDEIAAVAATTEKIAKEACDLIKVEYEILPAVYDPLEALKEDAPKVQPDHSKDNVTAEKVVFSLGDFEKGWAEGEVFAEKTVTLPRVKHVQLETHAAVADFRNGNLKVASTTQTPHPTKMILAHLFEIPESKVHVYNPPYVGGGFGVRIGISGKAEPIAAVLSLLAKKPVKYVYTREEDFLASDTRHGGYMVAKMAAKKDGTFVALDTVAYLNTGAYSTFGAELVGVAGACGTAGTYHIPNLNYEGNAIYTNQQTAGAFRGFGTPQGTFVVETLVDDIAKQLDMDPIEIRKMNTTRVGDSWWFPYPVGSTMLNECLDEAGKSIGWKEKRGKAQTGTIRRGVGIGAGTHVSNAAPFCVDYSAVTMQIEGDGSLTVVSAIPEIGAGAVTSLLQIASDVVGVPMESTSMHYGDTKGTPFDIGSHASRTLYAVGVALLDAGPKLKKDILNYAAEFLKLEESQVELVDGIIKASGKEISLKELAYEAHLRGKQFIENSCIVPPNSPPWHAHAAEVEVDMETGIVKVLKIAAAHDLGKAINPMIVEQQIEGAVVQGVGYAINEEMTYEEEKGFYNNSISKYMLPTAGDRPEIDTIILESADPAGPFGAKGVGECGLIPTAPAIVSAVEDAIGIRFYEIPMTPERVLKKIKEVYGE